MKEKQIGDKIIILGCPGAGKSTFSIKLHEITGLPLIHLDNIWWKPDHAHITRDEFDESLEKILCGDKWIIDGNYSRTYEIRLRHCDTVIFLDYSLEVCMDGIKKRVGQPRQDIPWTENSLDSELVDTVMTYGTKQRPVLYELFKKYGEKRIIIFNNRAQADEWLEQIS